MILLKEVSQPDNHGIDYFAITDGKLPAPKSEDFIEADLPPSLVLRSGRKSVDPGGVKMVLELVDESHRVALLNVDDFRVPVVERPDAPARVNLLDGGGERRDVRGDSSQEVAPRGIDSDLDSGHDPCHSELRRRGLGNYGGAARYQRQENNAHQNSPHDFISFRSLIMPRLYNASYNKSRGKANIKWQSI